MVLTFVVLVLSSSFSLGNAIEQPRWHDIDYVGDGMVGHRLDIYLPQVGPGPCPGVIYIYGSAFFDNNGKGGARGIAPILTEAGIAVAAINHRGTETDNVIFPALVHDVKASVRFIRANAAKYNLDPARIGATGFSSGGHLAAFLGTSGDITTYTVGEVTMDIEGSLGDHTNVSSSVHAVCDWFGPTDFLVMDSCGSEMNHNAPDSPESVLIGGPIQEHPDECALANPQTYVDSNDPPFMIIHGDKDPLVPHCNSESLDAALDKAGVYSDYILVEGAGHGEGLIEPFYLDKMVQFFKKHLTNECAEGDILWQKNDLGENLESGPAVDSSGNVYVIGNGTVYSYTTDGTFRWSTKTSPGDGCTPSISPDNSVVYTCGLEGVYALKASNGDQIWHSPVDKFHTVPCVSTDDSKVYITSDDLGGSGTIYALNASDGSTAWSHHPLEEDGFMGGAVLDIDGNILVPGQNAYLYSLKDNGNSFSVNWIFNLGAEARQPVTVGSDGYIYATSNTGVVHKINASTGKDDTSGHWPALGGIGEVFASMAFSPDGETLYVNAEDHKLHALNHDGSEKWTFEFEVWGSDPLVRDDSRIIVMGQVDGAVSVWSSAPICLTLQLNETNVNIGPDGTIFVHSGDQPPLGLFAIKGNGQGLSTKSPWPKYMGNIQNNGSSKNVQSKQ
jgi:acetyl esterase/lipase